jgi:antitoxin component of RelBE/YafQ-DinJ toxin-antitoxin module
MGLHCPKYKEENTMIKTATLQIRITPELKQKFDSICKTKGMSTADYIRHLVIQEIERNENK